MKKRLDNVLLVTTDTKLAKKVSEEIAGAHTWVKNCESVLRYIARYKDAEHIFIDVDSLGSFEGSLLRKEIHLYGPNINVVFLGKEPNKATT
jgi:hypothetical protein